MDPVLLALVNAGVLTQQDADRIDRSLDPQRAREYAEQLLTDAFRRGLTQQQRRILELVQDADGSPTQRQIDRLWRGEDSLLWASVQQEVLDVALERAIAASIGMGDDTLWQLVNQEVIDWAETYYLDPDGESYGSIPNLNVTSRTAFERVFSDWQRGELGISGRDERGELRQGLDALIAALEPTFGIERAERIGVTETTRIFSYAEIAAGNANPFIEAFVYNTANDERVTDLCRSGDGRIMLKGETVFSDGLGPPPRHVRCRSGIQAVTGPALEALREEGIIANA